MILYYTYTGMARETYMQHLKQARWWWRRWWWWCVTLLATNQLHQCFCCITAQCQLTFNGQYMQEHQHPGLFSVRPITSVRLPITSVRLPIASVRLPPASKPKISQGWPDFVETMRFGHVPFCSCDETACSLGLISTH